jgi:hypothetical protein
MKCYCAFCKSQRRFYPKKNINLYDIAGAALGTGVTMYAVWQEFMPQAIMIFAFYLAVAECFVQLRWRITLVCRHCGFDPALYVRNSEKALEKVKSHLAHRQKDPASLLMQPLNLPKITAIRKEQIEKAQSKEKGSLISRSV